MNCFGLCIVAALLVAPIATGDAQQDSHPDAQQDSHALRRQRAAAALTDGLILIHASSVIDGAQDGFRQDPFFYYLTGLQNTVGAILAITGGTGESWLFLHANPFDKIGPPAEATPGAETAQRLGIDHVVDWTQFRAFLERHAGQPTTLYYAGSFLNDLPDSVVGATAPTAPLWLQVIATRWSGFTVKDATRKLQALMEVQDAEESSALRSAARATVAAIHAGIRAVRPGESQRSVEAAVENACWSAGAHGSAFWPWAMSGANGVFPRPFASFTRYDHLDQVMRAGDLVRLDVGCEWNHYGGDLGRTVPVSGRYTADQRELWNIFVAAYKGGARVIRAGVTADSVFAAWRNALVSQRATARSSLAKRAIDSWGDRKNVPYWQIHTSNLMAGDPSEPFAAGITINFEPIASIDGQGYFLEDMYVVTVSGAQILTPGVPYSAEEIEAAMRGTGMAQPAPR